jgi:hypothetical protein
LEGKYNPEAYKKYYEENKETINARKKQWRLDNLEKIREKDRIRSKSRFESKKNYYENNKDILNEKRRLYREKNKVEINKYQNERYKKSREGIEKIKAPGAYNLTLAERNKKLWLTENLYLYHLKLIEDDGFEFYKYGLTKDIKTRLKNIPYTAEVLELTMLNKYDAVYKEIEVLNNVEKYIPQKTFGGYNECFVSKTYFLG